MESRAGPAIGWERRQEKTNQLKINEQTVNPVLYFFNLHLHGVTVTLLSPHTFDWVIAG